MFLWANLGIEPRDGAQSLAYCLRIESSGLLLRNLN